MIPILLNTAYLPPVQYFTKLCNRNLLVIEAKENYQKQTYRNRCKIMGPNDIQTLSVPVCRGSGKNVIRDVKIDYSERWQDVHVRSINAAYRSSPFYEFYSEEIFEIIKTPFNFLFDLNNAAMEKLLEFLQIPIEITFTKDYRKHITDIEDVRDIIHPKIQKAGIDNSFNPEEYFQVFSERHGFVENLSIIDLLFNLGPEAVKNLYSCVR